MAREETIKILIDKSKTVAPLQELKNEAKALKDAFGSIKIGDAAKALKDQASAAKEAANAATAEAKAQKEAANAEKARYSAVKELENATKAHLSAQKEEQNVLAANMKVNKEAANAVSAAAKAQREMTNAETAQIRQTILLNREQERQSAAMRRLGQDIGQVNASQAQSIQYMSQWIRQQEGLSSATVHATGAINNANGSFQTYRAAVSEAGGATHNYRMAVNTATGEVYQLDQGIRTTSVSLRDMSSILRAVRTVIGFTGIAQSMRSAFTEMKSMSDELVTYRKVTGATAQEMERIRTSAYETSKKYGQTPSDFLNQAATMARAGYGQNATAMAELATKTQLVGDMTADAASKFLIAVDAAYQLGGSVETLTHILDGANVIDNNYATTIEKISEGMTLTASLASSAHVPVEQLTAALGTMTAVTQRSGTETARGLRQIMLNIIGDTTTEIEEGVTVAEEEMSAMQQALMRYTPEVVKAAQATGKLINPMEAIAALAKQYKEGLLTETELFGITESIGGKRYYNVFTALIQNYDMYEEMLEKVMQSTGSADAEIKNMLDGWTQKANQLTATWTQVVNNTVSENFIKGLIDGGRNALEFAGNLENLAIMAGGALTAIRALTTGINNLSAPGATMTLDTFGRFNLGVGLLGIGITAIGAIKSAYEKNIRDMQKAAEEAVADAVEKSKSIESVANRYTEIVSDGVQEEKGELEELNKLQSELNKLVGEQGNAIDLVNGKYDETRKKLRELSKDTIRATLSQAVASFGTSNLNGDTITSILDKDGYSLTDVYGGALYNTAVNNWMDNSQYLRIMEWNKGVNRLYFKKPDNAEEIVAFYKEVEDFYTFLGSTTSEGKKAENGAKSMGEEFSTMYNALGEFVQGVKTAANPVKAAYDALDELEKELQDLAETTEEGSKGFKDAADSAYTLEKAIEGATKAKEKFDDAMKTSKADAFNDYVKAFQTLQGEIDAGRVNSTAFYASARMMLGDDAYNATGGTSEGVMAALNRKGSSGTLNRAGELLFGEYYDESGNAYEGAGLIELLRNTKGYGGRITQNASGGWNIPGLTEADINEISAAWGGLSKDLIMSFFEALDQYDVKGAATAEAVKAVTEKSAAKEAATVKPELPERVTENQNRLSESTEALANTTEQAAETVEESVQAIEASIQNAEGILQSAEDAAQAGEQQEQQKIEPEVSQAQIDLEKYNETLESTKKLIDEISEKAISPEVSSEDAENVKETLDGIKTDLETIGNGEPTQFDIKYGDTTQTTSGVVETLVKNLNTIKGISESGAIPVNVAAKLTGNLRTQLLTKIATAKSAATLNAIEAILKANPDLLDETIEEELTKAREAINLPVSGDPTQLSSDVDAAVEKERAKEIVLGVSANPDQADKDIDAVADEKRTATINVEEYGADIVDTVIDKVAKKERNATIKVQIEDAGGSSVGTTTPDYTGNSSSSLDYLGSGGGMAGDPPIYSILDAVGLPTTKKWAQGTRSHPGGLSMVNDGNGPELIIDNGRAFIAGNGQPAIVNLNKGAKVFTASETRQIFSGSGVPAYAKGTAMTAIGGSSGTPSLPVSVITSGGVVTGGGYTTEKPGASDDGGNKTTGGGSSSGGSSEKKTDEKAFENLSAMVDYIVKRIGEALDEQLDIIDKQIDALKQQKDALDAQNELEEKQKAVAEAQRDLETALSERTIRYLGEDGKWHWMADARNVQTAQENLQKAQDALSEYQQNAAYEAEVAALEAQKKALQEEYTNITDAWSKIQAGVETPTGDLAEMISAVLTGGTPQQQTGASAIRGYLIGKLLTGGSYSGNYSEALDSIAKATAGSPIMPDGSNTSLAALIATGGGLTGNTADALRIMNGGVTSSVAGAFGDGGTHINYNYFVNGMEIGTEAAQGMTLSEVMRSLTVYAGQ